MVGSDVQRIIQVEELYSAEESYMYLDPYLKDPLILHENEQVTLRMYGEFALPTEKLGFLGIVAEPQRRVRRKKDAELVDWQGLEEKAEAIVRKR